MQKIQKIAEFFDQICAKLLYVNENRATGKLLGVLTEGLLGAAAARLPQDFTFGPEGDLYVVSNEANAIQHYRVLGDRLEFMRTFASTWPEGRMHQE